MKFVYMGFIEESKYESLSEADSQRMMEECFAYDDDINPVQDFGFMYGRDIADLDGHVWGIIWMDMSAMSSTKEEAS